MALKTMYPAVAGSPATTTENTFVAGTTTSITVSQGSVLAAAPNLATITAADGRFVTVSYTSKSGNKISGLTALEGDKTGTFATGSIIARRYSAVDDSAIKGNIQGIVLGISSVLNVYVSPTGSDTTGDGTQSKPWREIQTAITKTASEPNQVIVINCAQGEYNTAINIPNQNQKAILLNIDTEVTLNDYIDIHNGQLIIVGEVNSSFSVITARNYGIIVYRGSELSSVVTNFNITAAVNGIRIAGETYGLPSTMATRLNVSGNLVITTTGSGTTRGVNCQISSAQININNFTSNNSGTGSALLMINGPSIAQIYTLTTNVTEYSVSNGSLLSINGKWVNQA